MDNSHANFARTELSLCTFLCRGEQRTLPPTIIYTSSFCVRGLHALPTRSCRRVRCRARLGSTHAPDHAPDYEPTTSSSDSSRFENHLEYIHNTMICAMRFLEQVVRRVRHFQPSQLPHGRHPGVPQDTFDEGETL